MTPTIKWLSNHWFILGFVFASGTAMAWQEVQRQTLSDVVVKQSKINDALMELTVEQAEAKSARRAIQESQREIKKKLDLMIELQLRGQNDGRHPQ